RAGSGLPRRLRLLAMTGEAALCLAGSDAMSRACPPAPAVVRPCASPLSPAFVCAREPPPRNDGTAPRLPSRPQPPMSPATVREAADGAHVAHSVHPPDPCRDLQDHLAGAARG